LTNNDFVKIETIHAKHGRERRSHHFTPLKAGQATSLEYSGSLKMKTRV